MLGCAAALAVTLAISFGVIALLRSEAKLEAQAAATTISMPPRAAGLVRSTRPEVVSATQEIVADLRAAGIRNAQAAGYAATPTGPVQAIAWGWSAPIRDPEQELRLQFRLAREGGTPAAGVAAYSPGPLGGVLRCGEITRRTKGSLCAWATQAAFAMVLVPGRKPDQAAPFVVRLRGDIEHRRG